MRRSVLHIGYRFLVVCLFISILVFVSKITGYAEDVRGVTDDTIKIGVIADLTGPTAVDISAPVVASFKLFYWHTNEQGGINGRKIKLIVEDDRYSIPIAMGAFKKLVFKDKIFALHGPLGSGASIALLGQVEKNEIPQINYASSKKVLVPIKRCIFTGVGLYDDDIKLIFEHIFENMKEKPSVVGIVYPDHEVGKIAQRAALVEAKRYGVKLHQEILNLGSTDATSQVLNLKRKKIKHIIIQETPAAVVALLRSAYKLGLSAKYYGTLVSTNEDIIDMGGKAVKDFMGFHPFSAWYEDTPGTNKMRELSRRYYKKDTPYRSRLCTIGHLGGMILNEGIKKAGMDLNNKSLIGALESIKNLDTHGISGPVSYSETDHQGIETRKFYRVDMEKKIFVAISDWIRPKYRDD